VFATDIVRARAAPKAIDVPLNGAKSFELTVDVGGMIATRIRRTGRCESRVAGWRKNFGWMTSGDRRRRSEACPSHSSTAGSISSEFINGWKREIKDEQLGETKLRRALTLTDPISGLEVQAVCTIYLDTAGIDWTMYFTNRGAHDNSHHRTGPNGGRHG